MKPCLLPTFVIYLFLGNTASSFSQELPIKPARTVSFTTDEGSYMNADVSPDGKTLVFDLLGDLYTVPSTGGEAKQLTHGIALHLRPVWSPNGKKMAYISDISGGLRLNVMDLSDGSNIVLAPEFWFFSNFNPIWTPDSRYIIEGSSAYSLAGGKISSRYVMSHPIRFSGDGKLLYGIDSNRLYVYDLALHVRKAISDSLSNFQQAALSPDGRWWCYIMDSDSGKCLIAENLINHVSRILIPSLIQIAPRYVPGVPTQRFSFSPDSKYVFISYGGKIHRVDIQDGADVIIPFVAKVKSDLGAFDYNTFRVLYDSVKVKYTRSARASLDGKHLVFTALDRIYTMDLPNGRPHPLVCQTVPQFQPAYSPDGRWIAYVTWCDTIGGYLWQVPASGGQSEQLTRVAGQYQRPTWSPDGKQIAVIKGEPIDRAEIGQRAMIGQLEIVSIEGKGIKVIDDSVYLSNTLAFSSDGLRIIYTPRSSKRLIPIKDSYPQLVSRDVSGKGLQVIAVGGQSMVYQQKMISSDGRYIVCSNAEDLYLLPTCQLIGPIDISPGGQNPVIRFAEGVDPYWEKGGKELTWTYGNRFYRVDPDKILAAARKLMLVGKGVNGKETDWITVDMKPDRVVTMHVTAPSLYAHGLIVLSGERIITIKKNEVIEHGTIVIKDGRIIAIGPSGQVDVPAGAKVFDLSGKTIMPGIVDLHLHMNNPANIFPQQSWMFLVNLAYGVTTARDPLTNVDAYGYKELLRTGRMIGPRLFPSGPAVYPGISILKLDSPQDAIRFVHKRAELGGTLVKDYLAGEFRLKREWVLLASRSAGLNTTNEGDNGILDLGMIKDGYTGIEHNPRWGDVYKDIISFFALSGIYFTPTLMVSPTEHGFGVGKEYFKYKYWHHPNEKLQRFTFSDPTMGPRYEGQESWEQILKAAPADSLAPEIRIPATIDARIWHQGGRVGLGSHGNIEGIGPHSELWALQMGGLTNMEALQAATIIGAEAIGIQKDVGSLEVGKIADLIVLNKNPLDDIHNSREIKYVMKDGILYDGDTLDELWPVYKKCPEWKLKSANEKTPVGTK
jgi:Tol biopolymer transport system component